jgi:hypothetical protein
MTLPPTVVASQAPGKRKKKSTNTTVLNNQDIRAMFAALKKKSRF